MPTPKKKAEHQLEDIHYQLRYFGDSCSPPEGKHDLRKLAVETISMLPEEVQDWFLAKTTHFFIGGSGQNGESFDILVPALEVKDDLVKLRVIYLSERLMDMPKDEVLWMIAHEIAHSWLDHNSGGYDVEVEVDMQVQEWGFKEPRSRKSDREMYR